MSGVPAIRRRPDIFLLGQAGKVSGAGVRKLVAARHARFREFAPLRLARPTPAGTVQAAIFG